MITTKNGFFSIGNLAAFMLVLCTLIGYANNSNFTSIISHGSEVVNSEEEFTVVIDPGHGGMDSGAVSVNGILEKDLNLVISKLLSEYLEKSGVNTVLTRTDDTMLSLPGSELNSKTQDLSARSEIANTHLNGIFVSIHMNKFTSSDVSGLQVWYSNNGRLSEILAQCIQSNVVKTLQTTNKRQVKNAGKSIYVLRKVNVPAVLVECGFLSNAEEEKLLVSPDYQIKLAQSIGDGILKYIGDK